jgi:lipoprotein-anchoring transpeptidase ErfK/SrfK
MASSIRGPVAQENLWAPADIAKPEVTPIDVSAFAVQAEETPAATTAPTQPPARTTATQALEEETATESPAEESTAVPDVTETPGAVMMEILDDTPTSDVIPDTPAITVGDGVRWIDVDLTNQMVHAYEGDTIINSFVVSTGTWLTPTVTGRHKIYVKVRMQDMSGPGYYLRDVPWVMFFSGDYGLHGTYWHNNFGTPMSRGCVNLTIDDAAWLFNWASVGTVVNVHY